MLPLPETEPLSEKQDRKKYAFVALSTSRFEMVLALPAEVIAFHMQAPMVQLGVSSLEVPVQGFIPGYWCQSLNMGLALDE